MQCGDDVRSATVFFVERELFFVMLSFFVVIFRRSSVNLAKMSVETSRCKFLRRVQRHIPKCDREEIVSSDETVF